MSSARLSGILLTLYWLSSSQVSSYYSLEVGDSCPTNEYVSSCQLSENCKTIRQFIENHRLTVETVLNCGYTTKDEKICCPIETSEFHPRFTHNSTTSTTTTATTTTSTTTTTTTTPTTTTTTTPSPEWLSIFNTDRDYIQRSMANIKPLGPDSIVFPGRSARNKALCEAPKYEGNCLPISQCESIAILMKQQRLLDQDVHTCRAGTTEEIICCPISLPLQPRAHSGTAMRVGEGESNETDTDIIQHIERRIEVDSASGTELLEHYKYLAALAYPNARFDGYVHRCTAMLLAPQFLLTSAACGRPSHAVFGVADMQDGDEESAEAGLVDITSIAVYQQDLALLRLPQPRAGGEASVCSSYERTRGQTKGRFVVSGWARGNASDCPLYELPMRLLPTSDCKDIVNNGTVQDLPSRHICAAPKDLAALNATRSSSSSSSCQLCPSVVGSVLHLVFPNGRRCVLGVATHTSDNCFADVMYFTSLVDRRLFKFVEDQRLNL